MEKKKKSGSPLFANVILGLVRSQTMQAAQQRLRWAALLVSAQHASLHSPRRWTFDLPLARFNCIRKLRDWNRASSVSSFSFLFPPPNCRPPSRDGGKLTRRATHLVSPYTKLSRALCASLAKGIWTPDREKSKWKVNSSRYFWELFKQGTIACFK